MSTFDNVKMRAVVELMDGWMGFGNMVAVLIEPVVLDTE